MKNLLNAHISQPLLNALQSAGFASKPVLSPLPL